ncbi:methylmalonyl Co-A mutase-associated GTPase MeaB [Iamia majanohamensis]|uniref:Methylmalonyl Co-A mutase-associated GTPase MeaB n=1 Tax=Iamia majanohamensis TaxID=467976 RepID=A0AAE9Y9J4_9ACTN|nr:methylmalonyl Co-A mutase-associated GTPase MeaB [Iamia majanohamensis]WCO66854.1 methylmalonyl Co-A mutase-associated GTPase MeaB [Iamia majanohamensis]
MSGAPTTDDELADLVDRARTLDKVAVARLIGVFEDARPAAAATRARVLELLDDGAEPDDGGCTVLGITGTPGSGKSSLLARLTVDMLAAEADLTVAVLAIDPSSPISGGALLGDRTRMRAPLDERRLFFRSQASATELGGLSPSSFQVCRLLTRLFRCVLVETVGIGQSEADIRHLADKVYLVLQPLGGDEVQFLKAGIIEVPDAFVLNKSDEPTAEQSYHHLKASLGLARPFEEHPPEIHRTSARTGAGMDELAGALLTELAEGTSRTHAEREPHFLERWVEDEWGRQGRRHLVDSCGGAAALLAEAGGFDQAQLALDASIRAALAGADTSDT